MVAVIRFSSLLSLVTRCGSISSNEKRVCGVDPHMRVLVLLVVAACSQGLGDPSVTTQITSARIVSRVGDTGTADETPKRARADEGVTMYAAIEAGGVWYSDAGTIKVGGKKVTAR